MTVRYLRESLTYDEKVSKDADRRMELMDRACAAVGLFVGALVIWMLYNGKIY